MLKKKGATRRHITTAQTASDQHYQLAQGQGPSPTDSPRHAPPQLRGVIRSDEDDLGAFGHVDEITGSHDFLRL
ncbi:MAG: hypothetical protein PVJ07_10400, partial [Anaerolineales bacterium]